MPGIFSVLLSWFPMLLFIGVWIFFMKQMQGGSKGAMGFGKSKAKLLTEHRDKVTFKDVAGIDEAKAEEALKAAENRLKGENLSDEQIIAAEAAAAAAMAQLKVKRRNRS